MKGLFGRKKKRDDRSRPKAGTAPVDADETIFINLSSDEVIDPETVRVEFDPEDLSPAAAPAPGAPPGDATPPAEGRGGSEPRPAPSSGPVPGGHPEADDRTQIWTAGGPAPRPDPQDPVAEGAAPLATGRAAAPPVAADRPLTAGLLMIVEGEGRGQILGLTLGRNKLGRGDDNEVAINYGDDAISRSNHATIAVDPKTERFFMIPGDSTNLAYLHEEPLLEAREIKDKAVIQLGGTKLIFIQILGNYLDWS